MQHINKFSLLREAYQTKKKIEATFIDGKVFVFEITQFDESATGTTWTISPEEIGDRKILDAKLLKLII